MEKVNIDVVEEQKWLDVQEEQSIQYLRTQQIDPGPVLDIEWCVAPYVALWRAPEDVWVISGDLPTDFLRDSNVGDARDAMKAISARWLEVSTSLLDGRQHSDIRIGEGCDTDELKELGGLLRSRAEILQAWTEDPVKWEKGLE